MKVENLGCENESRKFRDRAPILAAVTRTSLNVLFFFPCHFCDVRHTLFGTHDNGTLKTRGWFEMC